MSESTHYQRDERTRKRSRSPYRERGHERVERHRSRSPRRKHHDHHTRRIAAKSLPHGANSLRKDDYEPYKALFAEYLDVQKGHNIEDLDEREVKGRWKSFLGKWNHGELADGWYDTDLKSRVDERWRSRPPTSTKGRAVPGPKLLPGPLADTNCDEKDDSDDDDYGPALPDKHGSSYGAAIPSLDDIQHRQELAEEDRLARMQDVRFERKADRMQQKERLEEMAPRADAGTRERKLEKKQETTSTLNQFREAKDGGDVEVNDNDLMGGGEEGVEGYKKRRQEMERKKGEREIRKEEQLRARAAEREEIIRAHREKEAKTMENLKAIAKARFG